MFFYKKQSEKNKHVLKDMPHAQKYDMKLLRKLNEEWKGHPVIRNPASYEDDAQLEIAKKRAEDLAKWIPLQGVKLIEIGAGGGYLSYILARDYGCMVTAVDIYESDVWQRFTHPNLRHVCVDLSKEVPFEQNSFDVAISYVAWEHMREPLKVLQATTSLLKENGQFMLCANLYRSALASHLYRHIYFPWPHLLFDSELLIKYAKQQGVEQWWIDAFFHVNKLTYAQYKEYFEQLGYRVLKEHKAIRNVDLDFYTRFEDKLGLYPIEDLELDFFSVLLQRTKPMELTGRIMMSTPIIEQKRAYVVGEPIRVTVNAKGEGLTYAWYIYRDEERIKTIWYRPEAKIAFTPDAPGLYKVRAFAMDVHQTKRSAETGTIGVTLPEQR